MNIAFILLLVFTTLYAVVSLLFIVVLRRQQRYVENGKEEFISVIIAARNEEGTISECVSGIAMQNYSNRHFEIIVVDDHSEDATVSQLRKCVQEHPEVSITVLFSDGIGKKAALSTGIKASRGELIVTRDADTFNTGTAWLSSINNCWQNTNADMIIMPLQLNAGNTFLEAFQYAEHVFLQGLTAFFSALNSPVLCNGANLCFTKAAFNEIGAYAQNNGFASGDDVFLLANMNSAGKKVTYLPADDNSAVSTSAVSGLLNFLHQKVRWIKKAPSMKGVNQYFFLLIAAAQSLLFLVCVPLSFILPQSYKIVFVCFVLKCFIDILLLTLTSCGSSGRKILPWIVLIEIFGPIYFIFVPFAALLIKPVWKGRTINA